MHVGVDETGEDQEAVRVDLLASSRQSSGQSNEDDHAILHSQVHLPLGFAVDEGPVQDPEVQPIAAHHCTPDGISLSGRTASGTVLAIPSGMVSVIPNSRRAAPTAARVSSMASE